MKHRVFTKCVMVDTNFTSRFTSWLRINFWKNAFISFWSRMSLIYEQELFRQHLFSIQFAHPKGCLIYIKRGWKIEPPPHTKIKVHQDGMSQKGWRIEFSPKCVMVDTNFTSRFTSWVRITSDKMPSYLFEARWVLSMNKSYFSRIYFQSSLPIPVDV